MHVDEGLLQALLDGEVDQAAAAEARRHIDACTQCRGLLEALRGNDRWLEGVLRSIDHPLPRVPVETIVTRARRSRRPLRWAAAAAFVLLAAGTAYALPGSPVRGWIEQLVGSRGGKVTEPVPDVAGVALPAGQHFSIVFSDPHPAGSVTITVTDDSTISARRRGGAATFAAEIDRLRIITGSAPTDFEIAIPRQARWVEVVVGGRRVFLKDGPRVTTEARTDSDGRYIISL
jgi:anti-sigma factor RsiW